MEPLAATSTGEGRVGARCQLHLARGGVGAGGPCLPCEFVMEGCMAVEVQVRRGAGQVQMRTRVRV